MKLKLYKTWQADQTGTGFGLQEHLVAAKSLVSLPNC